MTLKLSPFPYRHPELVSGSILPISRPVRTGKWTLKQVQGDGRFAEIW
ncbi:hypothetical protein [Novosphingobium beihaiensis]|uniref:Uncharacterized protein n=1 Tax=Novosphingobium beihaiensis TaxID=2930389 RepID=A0ABT0BLW2_9SPHN|nr:hypothetical protein [Novosphingobium beihaiensis]MCJ2186051.1 hypothetical protein [Novosphingobium beihaiensis]